jgi:signal transduction histidine kinase
VKPQVPPSNSDQPDESEQERSLRVLLVEDNPTDACLFQAILRGNRSPIQLTVVDRLSAAVHLVQTQQIDLIVTDLVLPDSGSGSTFYELHEHASEIPIIVLSSEDSEAIALQCVEQGAQDYLVKGRIDRQSLLRSMRYAMERHRFQRELRRAHNELEKHVAERTEELATTAGRLEEALAQLKEAQERMVQQERLHALGRMASGIAHDFNNALAPIVGFSELLLKPSPTIQKKSREYLQLIHTAATDGAEVVRRLREFYRYRDEHDVFTPVSINELVRQVAAMTKPRWRDQALARGAHINFLTELKRVPPVAGCEPELRELLINLIFNAIDAIEEDGTITCRTFSENGSVILQLSDTGVGMTEDTRLRCLEPFFSTKADHGTGLGLSMVFGIVRRHDGTLDIESAPGRGTTITISLLPHEASKATPLPTPAAFTGGPLRILVVDDEPSIREVLRAYFKEDGHFVGVAIDGREGFELYSGAHWDQVETHRAIPHLNCDQLAAANKQIRPHIPVILITGFADVMSDVGDHPPAIDLVMPKPFTRDALRAAIGSAIARRAAAPPNAESQISGSGSGTIDSASIVSGKATTEQRAPRPNGDN